MKNLTPDCDEKLPAISLVCFFFFSRGQSSISFICSLLPNSVLSNFQSFLQLVILKPKQQLVPL